MCVFLTIANGELYSKQRTRYAEQQPATNYMKHSDESGRANEVLSERTSRLCAAMLRIGASLELDVVLQEIVENARELADVPAQPKYILNVRGIGYKMYPPDDR